MLRKVAITFIVLWLLGLITSHTMGGLINILVVAAVIVIVVPFAHARKAK